MPHARHAPGRGSCRRSGSVAPTSSAPEVSTHVGARADPPEQRLLAYLAAAIAAASRRSNGGHVVTHGLFSRACPGEVACDLTVTGLPTRAPVQLEPTGLRGRRPVVAPPTARRRLRSARCGPPDVLLFTPPEQHPERKGGAKDDHSGDAVRNYRQAGSAVKGRGAAGLATSTYHGWHGRWSALPTLEGGRSDRVHDNG